MFKRLLLEAPTAICVTVAFVTVSSIFISMTWRALRMDRTQVDRFNRMPLETENAHDAS